MPHIFSARTDWDPVPNRLTQARSRLVAAGVPLIDLTESNPTRCGFRYPDEEIRRLLSDPASLTYEPDPKGLPKARAAVAADYQRRGVSVSSDRILLTASSSEAYSFLFRLLAAPEEVVLAPMPCYPLFELLARINDVVLRPYGLDGGRGFRIDLEEIEREFGSSRPRALLLVSPGNPTGTFLMRDEVETLSRMSAASGVPIICDEVFGDYALEADAGRAATMAGPTSSLTFVLNGLSKMLALPQMKLGWIVVGGPEAEADEATRRLEMIADTFLSVNTPVQNALPGLLALRPAIQAQVIERLTSNRRYLSTTIGEDGPCRCLPTEGGWSAILQVPRTRSDEEWALTLLEQDQVMTHPGYFFDFPTEGHLVISLLPEPELFAEGVDRIVQKVTREV